METYGTDSVSPPKEGGKEAAHKKRARQIPGIVPVNTIKLAPTPLRWMIRDSNVPKGNVPIRPTGFEGGKCGMTQWGYWSRSDWGMERSAGGMVMRLLDSRGYG